MTSQHGALIVFGSGPGIGRNVAALFAEKGFSKVILMSRDTDRLKEDADFVKTAASGADVKTLPVDLADTDNVRKSLEVVDKHLSGSQLEAVLFNAARVGQSKMLEWPAESLETDLRISVVSLYIVAQWAMPKLVKFAEGGSQAASFLVTSGGLYKNPLPSFFSLASCKAAQHNLVNSLHKEFEPKGVHCALLVVQGVVSDEAKVTTARHIAEKACELSSKTKGEGQLDIEITDPDYVRKMKEREAAMKSS